MEPCLRSVNRTVRTIALLLLGGCVHTDHLGRTERLCPCGAPVGWVAGASPDFETRVISPLSLLGEPRSLSIPGSGAARVVRYGVVDGSLIEVVRLEMGEGTCRIEAAKTE